MRPRRQRLALGVTLLIVTAGLAGLWWHASQRAARARAPKRPRELVVQALWYSPNEAEPNAGTSQVTVRIEPKQLGDARVGIFEDEAQGTGDTWRASAWMATVVASLTAGIDLRSYVPSFTVHGRIDGPSAGALLAVAVLAGLTERDLRPKATLTGTIGPDGAIGPVGGVSQKIAAAAKAGLKLVLIPEGQRQDVDPETGRAVDVIAQGERLGVEVREVGAITAAYEALTGSRLRRPRQDGPQPKLAEPVRRELATSAQKWLDSYRTEMAECDRLRAQAGGDLQAGGHRQAAQESARRAQARLAEGNAAGAYDQAVAATLQAAAATDLLKTAAALSSGGAREAARQLAPRKDRDAEIGVNAGEIIDLSVDTVDGWTATADALGVVVQAAGLLRARQGLQSAVEGAPDEVGSLESLFKAAELRALDRHVLEIAQDRARLLASREGPRLRSEDALTAWATTMERAASASLGYFDAVALDETAKSVGVHSDLLHSTMEYSDPTYLMAQASLGALPSLQDRLQGKGATDAATLGASVGAYAAAEALVAQFYSLRVQISANGEIGEVTDTAALDRLLTSSASQARQDIGAARVQGLEASIPTYYYLVAAEYVSGGTEEQLEALQCYWQASLYARIGALMTGR